MRTFILGATLSLALAAGTGAMAQTGATETGATSAAESSVAASAVGHWLRDSQGNIIGSVRRLTDGDRTAVIMVGSYFRPGSHEERIPARDLAIVDGKVTLQTESALAMNRLSAQ